MAGAGGGEMPPRPPTTPRREGSNGGGSTPRGRFGGGKGGSNGGDKQGGGKHGGGKPKKAKPINIHAPILFVYHSEAIMAIADGITANYSLTALDVSRNGVGAMLQGLLEERLKHSEAVRAGSLGGADGVSARPAPAIRKEPE